MGVLYCPNGQKIMMIMMIIMIMMKKPEPSKVVRFISTITVLLKWLKVLIYETPESCVVPHFF